MPSLSKSSQTGSTKSERKSTLTEFIRDTCSLKQQQTAIFPAAIVLVNKKAHVWTLNYSGKLSTRLVDTDLEALAYTFLANHSSIRGSLKLSVTSNKGIHVTLSCSPPTAPFSMSASMILYRRELTKHI